MFKNVEEIKKAVNDGKIVYWKNSNYIVRKTVSGYLVMCQSNKSAFGLSYETEEGEILNGKLEDYFTL